MNSYSKMRNEFAVILSQLTPDVDRILQALDHVACGYEIVNRVFNNFSAMDVFYEYIV